jgi:hypothetical protein
MKKILIIITSLFILLFTSCSSNKQAKLLFTINSTTNLNTEELFDKIRVKVDVSIWYIDELDSDYDKSLITDDMSAKEIDDIIGKYRESRKEYYSQRGAYIALKTGLKDISPNYTIYNHFPSIGLTFNNIDFDMFEKISKLSDLNDIVEIQFYEY